MPIRRAAIVLATLALLTGAAGCGSTRVVGGSRQVQIALLEYRLVPQRVRARQGQLIIYAHNYGRLTHNLAVLRGAQTTGSTEPIPPGRTVKLVLDLTPGNYLMASTILSDRDLGIYGTLTIGR